MGIWDEAGAAAVIGVPPGRRVQYDGAMDVATSLATLHAAFGPTTSVMEVLRLVSADAANPAQRKALLVQAIERVVADMARIRMTSGRVQGASILQDAGAGGLDEAIDWLLSEERCAANELTELERQADRLAAMVGAAAAARLDEAVRDRCEFLRDKRWDLMAVRAESDRCDAPLAMTLDELRAAVGQD